jgi:outer membrane protein TolC
MKKFLSLLLLGLASVYAQNNLPYYLRNAETNSPLLNEYSNQISSSSLSRELFYSQQLLPQVSVTGQYLFAPYFNNNGHLVSTNPDPQAIGYDIGITNGGLYSAQINVEKNIFNGSTLDAMNAAQTAQEASIQHSMVLSRRDIAKQVTDQYLQVYESQKLYELATETSANLRDLLEIVGKLVGQGVSKQSEYLLLSIEYEGKNIATADAALQFKTSLTQLNTLCGIADTALVQVDSVSLTAAADAAHFEFTKKYELDSLAAASQEELLETKYRPQVSVFFNTGLNAVELEHMERKFGLSAGLNLSIPIFDGGQRSITRQQSELAIRSIAGYRENFAVQLKNQRRNSSDRLDHLRSNLNTLARQISGYRQLISMSERELQRGQLSMIEYLTVLRNYLELRKNNISAEIDVQREINNYNYWN